MAGRPHTYSPDGATAPPAGNRAQATAGEACGPAPRRGPPS
ncbi:hypothetical protein [Arthrobacter humicola]